MADSPMNLISGHLTGDAPLDTAVSRAILEQVSSGTLPETLQVGLPHKVVAFSRRDALTAGFHEAVAIAVDLGFEATIRNAGGRAVVFHPGTVRFQWTVPVNDPIQEMHTRFATIADHVVVALESFGVVASVGRLEGEYCPGEYSVHVLQSRKVMGTGQRLARRAAQVGGMIVVKGRDTINAVLEPVYGALDLHMDPAVTGSIADIADIDPSEVASRFAEQVTGDRGSVTTDLDAPTLAIAWQHRSEHDPSAFA